MEPARWRAGEVAAENPPRRFAFMLGDFAVVIAVLT